MLTESTDTGPSTATTHLVGSFEEVVERIRKEMVEYHPSGYGTHVTMLSLRHPGPHYHATIIRSRSCD